MARKKEYFENDVALQGIYAAGSLGTAGQVLKSDGDSVYWGTDSASGGDAATLDGYDSTAFVLVTDYEDSDVLTKIKNVDGSGSGLDADLLDGHDTSYFATASSLGSYLPLAGGTMTGDLLISAGHGLAWSNSSANRIYIENNGTNWTFNRQTSVPAYIDTPFYVPLATGVLTFNTGPYVGASVIWHAGNDGAGSGLDADLLDGMNTTTVGAVSSILALDSGGTATALQFNASTTTPYYAFYQSGAATNEKRWYWVATGGVLYLRTINDAFSSDSTVLYFTRSGQTPGVAQFTVPLGTTGQTFAIGSVANPRFYMYNSSGTASTLVAGADSGAAWIGTFTNSFFSLYANSAERLRVTTSGSLLRDGAYTIWDSNNDGSGSGLDADTTDGYHLNQNVLTTSSPRFVGVGVAYSGGSPEFYLDGGYTAFTGNSNNPGLRIQRYTGNYYVDFIHDTNGTGEHLHIAVRSGGAAVATLRIYPTTMTFLGNTVWHAGNDGAGSGLDADLLDGINSTSFARLDTDPTWVSGRIVQFTMNSNIALSSATSSEYYALAALGNGTGAAVISFHRPGSFAAYLGLDTDNGLKYGGWSAGGPFTVWHSGNDGSGSGLDADTVGGLNSTQFLRSDITQQGGVAYLAQDFNTYPNVYNVSFANITGSTNLPTGMASVNSYRFIMAGGDTAGRGVDLVVTQENPYANMFFRERTYGGWSKIWHNNNDGAGSGLDADLLDGYNIGTSGAAIGLLNAAWTRSAVTTFTQGYGVLFANSGATHGIFDYNNTALIITYNTSDWASSVRINSASTDIYANSVPLSWNGQTINLSSTANPRFYMYNNAGTASTLIVGADSGAAWIGTFTNSNFSLYANSSERLRIGPSGSLLRDATHTMWDANNDGAGSGLDADLLDGYSSEAFARLAATSISFTSAASGFNVFLSKYVYFNIIDQTSTDGQTGIRITTKNGAGVDKHTYIYTTSGNDLRIQQGSGTDGLIWTSGNGGSGSGLDADLLDGMDSGRFVSGGATGKSDGSQTNMNSNTLRSGFYYANAPTNYSVNDWLNWIQVRADAWGDGSQYGFQIAGAFHSDNLHYRRHTNGTYYGWNSIWHAGSDGAGSGLDADLLDGLNVGTSGSAIPNLAAANIFGTVQTITAGTAATVTELIRFRPSDYATGKPYLFIQNVAAQNYHIGLWDGTNNNGTITFDTAVGLPGGSTVGGYYPWTSNNDGAGSGLDADLLDGYNTATAATASTVAVRDSSGDIYSSSIYVSNWLRTTGSAGWYSQTYGGGTWMEDTTYVKIYGSKALYVANNIDATGNITAYYSDERLKERTGIINGALDKIESLDTFYYKENDIARSLGYKNDKEQVGMSAQQIQKVLPHVVHRAPVDIKVNEDGTQSSKSGEEYLTVDYARVMPLAIAAIKELRSEVASLRAEIASMRK
jgi:hypothetical protein